MLVLVAILFVLLLAVISLFAFPQISAVPYFPTNRTDISLIIRSFRLQDNQVVIDLGAGTGAVVFEAAKKALKKKLNTKFVAVELNPILLLIMYIKRYFHQNKKNIKIVYADMFKTKFKKVTIEPSNHVTIYLYISPWFLEKISKKLKRDLKKFELVSYYYPLPNQKPTKIIRGRNKIFIYQAFSPRDVRQTVS